ncbi:MAG: hypothetical protein IPH06_00095 [Alphaproteobacteria bacterium]|nr:hypothetical protein [Alphaproteobacteria bacterium]
MGVRSAARDSRGPCPFPEWNEGLRLQPLPFGENRVCKRNKKSTAGARAPAQEPREPSIFA